ncbi:zinc finger dihydrouridine synthase [Infundibulicybe gibba]|nr:zinc finger dihydrouridine synthase [Infundibulicybe gibba]
MHPPGTAPVKAEYLLYVKPKEPTVPDDDGAEGMSTRARGYPRSASAEDGDARSSRSKGSKEQRKAQRGANKGRKFGKARDDLELCWKIANGSICEFGSECRFTHDIEAYLVAKQRDIRIPDVSEISDSSPFMEPTPAGNTENLSNHSSIVSGVKCPVFAETGECRYGFKCRFLGGHVREQDGSLQLVGDEDTKARAALTALEVNFINPESQRLLRTKKYPCPIAKAYVQQLRETEEDGAKKPKPTAASVVVAEPEQDMDVTSDAVNLPNPVPIVAVSEVVARRIGDVESSGGEYIEVPLKPRETKRLDWAGKTYLAPLTTVGNLPFRRLCVDYGVDITCGEMGLANSFLAGSKEEWSLVRRHPSEKIFGVQLAGNKPLSLVSTAEILAKECAGNIDFVDINCGCPIDLVFKTGSGSALLDAPGKLGKIIVGMTKALDGIPVTVKLRTGIKDGKNIAHKLMPRLATEWGASCISLHGRTRQQRYTKLADWDYIKECVAAVRAREAEQDLPPVPIFGGGDCYSSQDYWSHVEGTGVDGVMIGRGALIKPWIFTEVKERREWDISARERLDLIKKYAEYGINHFGSDTTGVNATRRYLCEALSFQYRYVPIGLLERLPGRINDRAPAFRGRSDLETLLASSDSQDWVKISEMFLGPAPESWSFTPKHRSNAAGTEESQG